MAAVLLIQALFFADGGFLAYGCNVFYLAFITSFIAYPFIFKKIIGASTSTADKSAAAVIAAVVGLQMEANIDDMSGEAFGFLMDRLFETGALDVACNPCVMKKSRPGTVMSVLCPPARSSRKSFGRLYGRAYHG